MHNTFNNFYKCPVFTSNITVSKDAFTHQIVSIWDRDETGTDKPCAYMGPGRSTLDPFPIWYQMDSLTAIQFGTAPNGTELHGTHVNTA